MNFLSFLTSGASNTHLLAQAFNRQLIVPKNSTFQAFKVPQSDVQSCQKAQFSAEIPQVNSESMGQIKPELLEQSKLLQELILQEQRQMLTSYVSMSLDLMNQTQKLKEQQEELDQVKEAKSQKKKIKKYVSCGHPEKEHYAKGMCSNCYHKHGRTKKPWNCRHQKMYAAGLCQNCYINQYNKKKREQRDQPQQIEQKQ